MIFPFFPYVQANVSLNAFVIEVVLFQAVSQLKSISYRTKLC